MRPAALGAVLLLGGCAMLGRHSAESELAWQARQARLKPVEQFTVQARVSSGFFGTKADLHWRQRSDGFDMRVAGPFGTGAVQISGDAQSVILVRTAKESFSTREPERLLQERLGWTFPVSRLRWWALGLPAPGSDFRVELDERGRAMVLEQDGWTLEFEEYRPAGALELPRRFELASGEVKIKAVIHHWSDLSGTPPL